MLYKYSVILDINPMVDKYEEIKNKLDQSSLEFNPKRSFLQEMSIKEQLKFYIDEYLPRNTDRVRMIELIDKL